MTAKLSCTHCGFHLGWHSCIGKHCPIYNKDKTRIGWKNTTFKGVTNGKVK